MPRLAAYSCWALFTSVTAASACSGDDPKPPVEGGGNTSGKGSSGSAGRGSSGGKSGSDAGGESSGGSSSQGGKQGSTGGAAGAVGAVGGDGASEGGALGGGGDPAPGSGGEPVQPLPPDLITSSGGPWPDSLTGTCSNGKNVSGCPQEDGAYFGQDGTYRINVPSYVATASTLEDEITHLVWQLVPPSQELTQTEAATYCDSLELAGQSDWRLPTRVEYVSLLDEGQGAGYALPGAIPLTATGIYWTSSTSGVTEGLFFVVADADGAWNVVVDSTKFSARCVRGTPLQGSLTSGSGVVTDSLTGLAWQTTALDETPRTWAAALDYCETLTHAGKQDWRLPSIKELATLVDETAEAAPVVAADFGGAATEDYWSSTPTSPYSGQPSAFTLDTDFGISLTLQMGQSRPARCVRTAD